MDFEVDGKFFIGTYRDYLNSPHWREMRILMRQRAGGLCKKCHKESDRLQIHHLTYERLGHELESDLIVLCPECHEGEHGL